MLEILLLFFGLKALITGTFNVGSGEAEGLGARLAGILLILPLPITLLIVLEGMSGPEAEDFLAYYWSHGIFWVELGLVVGCGLVGFIIASISAHSRGYSRGGMRYRTEARDDIYLARGEGRPSPGLRKKARRRPPRPSRDDEIEDPEEVEEVVDELEEVEDDDPPARRRRRPPRRQDEDEGDFR